MSESKNSRRNFISKAIGVGASLGLSSPVWAVQSSIPKNNIQMRFAVASDGHYGQPDTDFERFHNDFYGLNKFRAINFFIFSILLHTGKYSMYEFISNVV